MGYLEHVVEYGEVSILLSLKGKLELIMAVLLFRLSTVLQILLFLPLTLATLSTQAFLLLSLLLFIHSIIHGTLLLLWGSPALSILQVPMHPFLLLLCFNIFSQSVPPILLTAATWWGKILSWSSPWFIVLEGLSSLLVSQRLGQVGRQLAGEGEGYQFTLLVASAVAYVASAWWIGAVSSTSFMRSTFILLTVSAGLPFRS